MNDKTEIAPANNSSRRLRSPRTRMPARFVAALLFAILAVAAVVWQVAPWRSGAARATNHEHEESSLAIFDGAEVHPIPEDDFRSLSSVQDVQEAMSDLERQIVQQVRAVDGLSTLPIEDQMSFAQTAAEKITPYLTGDYDTYFKQFTRFGGATPDRSSMKGIELTWEAKSPMLRYASVALEYAQTRRLSSLHSKGAFGANSKEMFALGMARPSISSSQNRDFYPAVAEWQAKGLDAFEVRVPIRLTSVVKDEELRLAMIGVAFAQNPKTGQWQPVETRLYHSQSKEPIPTSRAAKLERSKRTPGTIPL